MAEWIDLLDPSEAEIRASLPRAVHETALELLLAPSRHDDEPRPRLEGHDHYVFGVFLIPIAVREEDRIYYQELDLVATRERVLTVRKTPERGDACDLGPVAVPALAASVSVELGRLEDALVSVVLARARRRTTEPDARVTAAIVIACVRTALAAAGGTPPTPFYEALHHALGRAAAGAGLS